MKETLHILIADDNQFDAELVQYELKKFGFTFKSKIVETEPVFREALSNFNPDIVISDYSMPHFDGIKALQIRNEFYPHLPFIIVTGANNEEIAVECIKAGASDYVLKDNLKRLGPSVKAALEQRMVHAQKKQLEIEILKREELYRQLVENQTDLICRWNLEFELDFVNESYACFLGYPAHEFIGKKWLQFLPENSRQQVKNAFIEKFIHPHVSSYTNEVLNYQGDPRWLEWTDCPLFNSEDLLIGFQSIGRDITERRMQQKQIEDNSQFIHSLLESIPLPVFFKDLSLRYTGCNTMFEAAIGRSRKEIIGKSSNEISEKKQSDVYLSKDLEILQSGKVQSYEGQVKDSAGLLHDVIFRKNPIFDAENKIIGIIGTYFDISERKIMEDALIESEMRYRMLIENQGEGLGIVDLNEKFVFVNPAAEVIFDVPEGTLINRSVQEFLTPNQYNVITKETGNRLKNIKSTYELEITTPKGELRILLVTATPQLDKNNRTIGTFGVFRNITDRKKAEQALTENHALYQTFLNGTSDFAYLKNENLEYLIINNANAKYFRKKPQEIIGRTDFELMDKKFALMCQKSDKAALRSNSITITEETQGTNVFETRKFPVILSSGKIGVGCFIRDITELKKAREKEIAYGQNMELLTNLGMKMVSQNKNKGFFNFVAMEVHKILKKGIIIINSYNPSDENFKIEALVGIMKDKIHIGNTKEKIIGKTFLLEKDAINKLKSGTITMAHDGLFHLRSLQLPEVLCNSLDEAINMKSFSVAGIIKKDEILGSLLILYPENKLPVPDAVLNILLSQISMAFQRRIAEEKVMKAFYHLETMVDERTKDLAESNEKVHEELIKNFKIQQELEASNSITQSLIQSIPYGLDIISLKGNPVFTNKVMKDNIEEKLVNKEYWSKCLHEESRCKKCPLNDVFNVENTKVIDCHGLHKDRVYSVSHTGMVYKKNQSYLRIFIDVTETRKAEVSIKEALEKEKEVNLLKSRFISVVSHEFRTPLAGIQSSIQLLENYHNKLDEKKKKHLFSSLYETIRYTSFLLEDISIIGRDDSGRLSFNETECNITNLCLGCIENLKASFEKEVYINFVIHTKNIVALADESLLRHILTNILSNSIKYTETTKPIKFEVMAINDTLTFTITDQGKGIPEKDLPLLFVPFHRAANVGNIKGTGLGLSIVKRCAELHNGTVELTSKVGKGTKVILKIPFRQPKIKRQSK